MSETVMLPECPMCGDETGYVYDIEGSKVCRRCGVPYVKVTFIRIPTSISDPVVVDGERLDEVERMFGELVRLCPVSDKTIKEDAMNALKYFRLYLTREGE